MAKSREIACEFYLNEGNCRKGRDGTFRKQCQICNLYKPIRGGQPARPDTRREKKQKYLNDKRYWDD